MNQRWHTKGAAELFKALDTGEDGLTHAMAQARLRAHGPNALPEAKRDSLGLIFFRQFQSPLIYVLLAAAALVFFLGKFADGFIICAVLIFNAIVGTIQEGKAQNTLQALRSFVTTTATVIRNGEEAGIPDRDVVPGDLVVLREGERIPADARLIAAHGLKIDEAALTGESIPVEKMTHVLVQELPIAEQKNMIFKGTTVLAGRGTALIVATGVQTVIGKIAKEVAAIDTEIPLKANIRYLSRLIIIVVASISLALVLIGLAAHKPIAEMFVTVVALAVSIIPEGLPIVITLVLARGVWRMSRRHALVKKLQAVEALGQARLIAVDKTGTITKNEMVVTRVYAAGKTFHVDGVGYDPRGAVSMDGVAIDAANHPELLHAAKVAAWCANAKLSFLKETNMWHVAGDPTEAALLVLGQKLGFHKEALEREGPQVAEIPFDYRLKYHATVHRQGNKNALTVVGAPEEILRLATKVKSGSAVHPLTQKERSALESIVLNFSEQGLRVLAYAEVIGVPEHPKPSDVTGLTFGGFFGMKDALRPEVAAAMAKARAAGIEVVMITGDHKVTATAIAREAGILRADTEVITGNELDALSDRELAGRIDAVSVFARVTPEHKLRIIKAYQANGRIVAMTGDGVNDAPSLVAADLGVAMGKIGTEVAKEAADIVLLDDNFGSIVDAVEEGRSMYRTIKKVILYLFSTSAGEVLTIAGALVIGLPLPILPAQIIWLNFVTDGFLDVALSMEPKERGLLSGKFERSKRYLVDKLMAWRMFFMAPPMAIGTLYLFVAYLGEGMVKAWTVSLTTLAVFQWFNAWNCRSHDKSILELHPFSNKALVAATFTIIALQLFVVYHPAMQAVFHTTALTARDWLIIVPTAASILLIEEARKFGARMLYYRRT